MKVAVVGCGAAAEFFHLPALAKVVSRDDVWLVDADVRRARALARRFGRPEHVRSDHRDVRVDAAIVAVPNHLHAPVAIDLLRRRTAVLCEKPLGRTAAEARAIVAAAESGTLACGLFRRLLPSTRRVASQLVDGRLGRPLRFRLEEGFVYSWGAVSGYALDRERAGGGVTIDVGPHVLDQLRTWLGDVTVTAYRDDAYGGVEADAVVEVEAGGVPGVVELSRTRALGSRVEIECDLGTIAAAPGGEEGESYEDAFEAQLRRFLDGRPVATGDDGVALAELLDDCYARRAPLPQPWTTETLAR